MKINRRQALSLSLGAATVALVGLPAIEAQATPDELQKKLDAFTGGKKPQSGKITLTAPEIAENGNTVPISVDVDSAMSGDDLVESVAVYADKNPKPDVIVFHFTPLSGKASATTRMRLATTQNVVAVARMKDGSVYMDKKAVKVTIGGCGG